MQNDYLIKITGKQTVDGESDITEVITTGRYELKNGHRYIVYKEYPEGSGDKPVTTIVKYDCENSVSIIRPGVYESRLLLEKDKRHQCHYRTPLGDLMIGVFTYSIRSTLCDDGGELEVNYSLDFNSDLASVNNILIEVKKQK